MSMVELGIFLAVMIALVVCGCMATRAPKKTSISGSFDVLPEGGKQFRPGPRPHLRQPFSIVT
jgi:hypothetical protein